MSRRLAVVLAAGKGARMKSDLPKVLHTALGRPIVEYVLDVLEHCGVDQTIMVVGYEADKVRRALAHRSNLTFVTQAEQLGTGHAVQVCRDQLSSHTGPVLVLAGDSPMLQAASIRALFDDYDSGNSHSGASPACIMGTLHKENPQGLGRIVRDQAGEFVGIVEEKDATDQQRKISEVNMSTYLFDCRELLHALDQLTNANEQREYYLTDCPGILSAENKVVRALPVLAPCEAFSINTLEELAIVEEKLREMT